MRPQSPWSGVARQELGHENWEEGEEETSGRDGGTSRLLVRALP